MQPGSMGICCLFRLAYNHPKKIITHTLQNRNKLDETLQKVWGYIVAVQIVNHFRQILNQEKNTLKGITHPNNKKMDLVTYLPPFIEDYLIPSLV